MRTFIDIETEKIIKNTMRYNDGSKCCASCSYFIENDMSGNTHSKPAHCTTANVFDIRVEEKGICDFWKERNKI